MVLKIQIHQITKGKIHVEIYNVEIGKQIGRDTAVVVVAALAAVSAIVWRSTEGHRIAAEKFRFNEILDWNAIGCHYERGSTKRNRLRLFRSNT